MATAKCFIYKFASTYLRVNYWRSLKFNFKYTCIKNKFQKQWKCVCDWWSLITADIDCGFLFYRFSFLLLFPLCHFRAMGISPTWFFLRETQAQPNRTMARCWGNTWQVRAVTHKCSPHSQSQDRPIKQCATGKAAALKRAKGQSRQTHFCSQPWQCQSWNLLSKALEILEGMLSSFKALSTIWMSLLEMESAKTCSYSTSSSSQ